MTKRRIFLLSTLGIIGAIQLVPVSRSNPPVTADLVAPDNVRAILRRSCYDCHSHESTWPWYAYVAPVSWFIAHDVNEAREHLNFSTWADRPDKLEKLKEEIWEEVEEGEMPPPNYLRLHGDAKLSAEDRATLRTWSTGG
jgi:hypothetical protein